MYKVLIHVDQIELWEKALGNCRNLIKGIDQLDVEFVVNSKAVKGYLDEQILNEIRPLKKSGVRFIACSTALKSFNIKKEQLDSIIETVPSGVVELVIKQTEGYSYIKP